VEARNRRQAPRLSGNGIDQVANLAIDLVE
jgi:hypothetical protein